MMGSDDASGLPSNALNAEDRPAPTAPSHEVPVEQQPGIVSLTLQCLFRKISERAADVNSHAPNTAGVR
jgi:hypothetical protein